MADDESRADDGEDAAGSAPLGDLAERVRARRGGGEAADSEPGREDAGFGLEEFFQEGTYEEIDTDDLWESLDAEPDQTPRVEAGTEPDEHIVSKRSYCEGCEHFSEPPEVSCTHPGTTIVEFVDINHVRVRNCPVVADRQSIGTEDDSPITPESFGGQ